MSHRVFEKGRRLNSYGCISEATVHCDFPARQEPIHRYKCLGRCSPRIAESGVSAHRLPASAEGSGGDGGGTGGGGGSVQLLTGGRRVSQASPTLSPAILEPSPSVNSERLQTRRISRFSGYTSKVT